jgi:hypothetical protein
MIHPSTTGGKMTNEEMRAELRAHIARVHKTQTAAAAHWATGVSVVNMVLKGKREPYDSMLRDAGLERVKPPTFYRKIKKEKAA